MRLPPAAKMVAMAPDDAVTAADDAAGGTDADDERSTDDGSKADEPAPDVHADEDEVVDVGVALDVPLAPAPRPRRGWVLPVVLAVIALAAVGFGGFQWRHAHDLGDRESVRSEVGRVAGLFGEALLSYDYNDLATARDRVLAHATDRFGQEYTTAFTGGLETAITKLQATSTATVRDVYLADVERDTARAIVTLDSEVRSTAGTRRTVSSYLDMALVHQNGQWKVDSVTSVAALDQTTTPSGTDSSTTTVPGAPTTTAPLVPTPSG
jgi:Mce-associated membrane protein